MTEKVGRPRLVSGEEPTGTMNRAGRTSATKWEASGTAARVAWRHRVSSLFCHSTASAAREKGARTTSRIPSLRPRMPFFLAAVIPHYRPRGNVLRDDSPRAYRPQRFRRPNSSRSRARGKSTTVSVSPYDKLWDSFEVRLRILDLHWKKKKTSIANAALHVDNKVVTHFDVYRMTRQKCSL